MIKSAKVRIVIRNNTGEAYTGKFLGHKEFPRFLKSVTAPKTVGVDGDNVAPLEANTEEIVKARFPMIYRGRSWTWHENREMYKNLGGLFGSWKQVGSLKQETEDNRRPKGSRIIS